MLYARWGPQLAACAGACATSRRRPALPSLVAEGGGMMVEPLVVPSAQ